MRSAVGELFVVRRLLLLVAACGSSSEPAPVATRAASVTPVATVARRWIPGDLHVHPAPFDVREGASLTPADLAELGPRAGLEWAILTPHVRPPTWSDPGDRKRWLAKWTQMASEARAVTSMTLIPGTEYTDWTYGHFGVSGVDLATLGDDVLASAHARGAFIVVNHPFAEPTHIPGFAVSEMNLSFRPWTTGHGAVPHLDGVEVYNLPLGIANVISSGPSGETRAFTAADELARREHRPIAVVGGSDTHSRVLTPTTWVLAPDAREASILAALRAGATCVGGPEAGSLEARGDDGRWAAIGESVIAKASVTLRWTGRARLYIDGADAGEHDGGFTHAAAGAMHTYRIVVGGSRCGFVYANR